MYNAYTLKQLQDNADSLQQIGTDNWVQGRPVRYPGVWNDIKLAWLVLTRQADVVVWPQDVNSVLNNKPFVTKIHLDEDNRMLRMGFGKHKGRLFFRIDLWYNGFRFTR